MINHSPIVGGQMSHSTTLRFGTEKWNWKEISCNTLVPFIIGEIIMRNFNNEYEKYVVEKIETHFSHMEDNDKIQFLSRVVFCKKIE